MEGSVLNRRDFLRTIGAASLAAAGRPLLARAGATPPNILLLMTDQSRSSVWNPPNFGSVLPTRGFLARQGVKFRDFYVNSIPCSPNRASMFTGLHAHQHWILDNCQIGPSLDTGFPTVGSMLRDHGYHTMYFGKWHLTNAVDYPPQVVPRDALQPYGFDQWRPQTAPKPRDYSGTPNQGYELDDSLTESVVRWLRSSDAATGPWFAVASLLNPHDASYYPASTEELIAQIKSAGEWVDYGVTVPANYEPLSQLHANKPACQAEFQHLWAGLSGQINQAYGVNSWGELLNFYLWLEARVDADLGRIVGALRARPSILSNTVVIYTSDHGELGGSHGMKGKACVMYEEQNHIPLTITDFTGRFMAPSRLGAVQPGLGSSIDLLPSILELAGVPATDFPYLPGASLVPALAAAGIPGQPFVLASEDFYSVADSPCRVIHYHDERWKVSLYNNWIAGTDEPDPEGEEGELYDLTAPGGSNELDNIASTAPEFQQLRSDLMDVYRTEILAAPLPGAIGEAQERARTTYLQSQVNAPDIVLDDV